MGPEHRPKPRPPTKLPEHVRYEVPLLLDASSKIQGDAALSAAVGNVAFLVYGEDHEPRGGIREAMTGPPPIPEHTALLHLEHDGRLFYVACVMDTSNHGEAAKLPALTRRGAHRRAVRWAIGRGLRLIDAGERCEPTCLCSIRVFPRA